MNQSKFDKIAFKFPPYYKEISSRLTSYFTDIKNLEKYAEKKGHNEGFFIKKANNIIKTNIGDNEFKVDDFAGKMALSRSQLFRKLKSLTNMSPSKYMLFYRLQTAKELLRSDKEDLNVSEVCYKVGFISKSHFTRAFQKQFGFNPSECK